MPVPATKSAVAVAETGGIFRALAHRKLVLGLLLVVVTLALYNPVSRNGFVNFDDDRYVTDNPQVRAGFHWRTVTWAFTSREQANWHPLTWLSHALDCQLFGLNPIGHHYINLLLHAANALLLFLILKWFTGYTARSLLVAALFAVHPLNVESVAWVAERKSVLGMLFFLLTLAAYGWYVRKPGIARYLAVVALFTMGLMSKPMVITLPFVLLLLDYWPLRRTRTWLELCFEKLPLMALSAASAVITMIAQRAGGAVVTKVAHNPLLRLENAIVGYGLYIEKAVWPSRLAALYPYPHALPAWQVAASALVLLAITCAVVEYREHRYLWVGWLWFLGTMVPMIGVVQVGNQAMADRYAYLPMIGLFVMAVWAAAEWASARTLSAWYLGAVGLAILAAFSVVTRAQIRYWHDDFTLWRRALDVTQNNFVAENNFAGALIKQGRYDEAITHFRAANALEPADATSHLNLGIYAQQHGDLKQAAARYSYVLRLATDTQLRASAYANLGTIYFAWRDYGQAQQNFDSAAKLKPALPIALLDMGLMAQRTARGAEDWNRAAGYFAQFVSGEPSDVGYLLLAHALEQAGRTRDARLAYQQAEAVSTDLSRARLQADQLLAQ